MNETGNISDGYDQKTLTLLYEKGKRTLELL